MSVDLSKILNTGSTDSSTQSSTKTPRDRLGQADFLNLMTTQLKNQDPSKPLDSTQLFSQLAQFSTVAGIQDLQTSFSQFATAMKSNEALQATALVGHQALVSGDTGSLSQAGGISGAIDLQQDTGDLQIGIYDAGGQIIRHLDLGAQSTGSKQFSWDGIRDDGQRAAPGLYKIKANAMIDGKSTALDTSVMASVDSITFGASGQDLMVNLAGIGSVPFAQIKQVK
jgi:flagellar basal-body rod modification protein FlgD